LPVLARLLPRRPAMRVQITAALSDELAAEVENGQLDLAVLPTYGSVTGPMATRAVTPDFPADAPRPGAGSGRERFMRLPLIEENLCIVASSKHPLAQRDKVPLRHLQQQRWVLPKASSRARMLIDDAFATAGLTAPTPALEVDSVTHGVLDLILSLDAVAAVPEITLQRAGHLPLVRLPVPLESKLSRHISVLGRSQAVWSPLMKEFCELLVQDLGGPFNEAPPADHT